MFCQRCGTAFEQGAFCPNCGTPVNTQPAVNTGEEPTTIMGNEPVAPQAPVQFAPYAAPSAPQQKPEKKKINAKPIIIAATAAVVVAAIVIGSVAVAFTSKPQVKIFQAIYNTLVKSDSFDFEFEFVDSGESSYYGKWSDKYSGNGSVDFGATTTETELYIQASCVYTSDSLESTESYYAAVSGGKGVAGYVEDDGDGEFFGGDIANIAESAFSDIDSVLDELYYGGSEEAKDELEEYTEIGFEKIAEWAMDIICEKGINEDVVEEIYNSLAIPFVDGELGIDEEVIPSYNKVKDILTKFITKGLNDEALIVNDKYTEDGIKYYEIELDLLECMDCVIAFAQDDKDVQEILAAIEDEYDFDCIDFLEELRDEMSDNRDDVKEMNALTEIKIGIDNGFIAAIEYDFGGDEDALLTVELSNFKKASGDYAARYNEIEAIAKKHEYFNFDSLETIYDMI